MACNQKCVRYGGLALALAVVAGLAQTARADLNFLNFNDLSQLSLVNAAIQTPLIDMLIGETDRTISITRPLGDQAGAVWANTKQNVVGGFTTDFFFRIRDRQGIGADGLAFVIQEDPRGTAAVGGKGGAIGFGTNSYFPSPTFPGPGISHSVAIVFDTWDNSGDWISIPGTNIITVQLNANPAAPNDPRSSFSIANAVAGGAFNDGSYHHVEIKYQTGQLQVFFDSPVPIVTAQLDIGTQLALSGSDAFVGFTGSTGGGLNRQRPEIRGWSFDSTIPGPATASLVFLGGLFAASRRRPT